VTEGRRRAGACFVLFSLGIRNRPKERVGRVVNESRDRGILSRKLLAGWIYLSRSVITTLVSWLVARFGSIRRTVGPGSRWRDSLI